MVCRCTGGMIVVVSSMLAVAVGIAAGIAAGIAVGRGRRPRLRLHAADETSKELERSAIQVGEQSSLGALPCEA